MNHYPMHREAYFNYLNKSAAYISHVMAVAGVCWINDKFLFYCINLKYFIPFDENVHLTNSIHK